MEVTRLQKVFTGAVGEKVDDLLLIHARDCDRNMEEAYHTVS